MSERITTDWGVIVTCPELGKGPQASVAIVTIYPLGIEGNVLHIGRNNPHSLGNLREYYIVIDGEGFVNWKANGELKSKSIKAGEVVEVPGPVERQVVNVGSTNLVFAAVCAPAYDFTKERTSNWYTTQSS